MRFVPLREDHLPFLRALLKEDHIRPYWPEEEEGLDERFLTMSENGAHGYVLEREGAPSGFLQYYNAGLVGDGWWPKESPETLGMDLMLSLSERGRGPEVIRAFADFIQRKHPEATSVIVDPNPENARAVKAFAKAGFLSEGKITTPDGWALLMRKRFKE